MGIEKKLIDITGLTKYHERLKSILDGKQAVIDDLDDIRTGAAAGASALESAKAYVDDLVKDDAGNSLFDDKGAAAQALADAKEYADQAEADAKAYADGLATNYDSKGAAAAVAGDLADHEADTVSHITATERTAWNAAEQNAKAYADSLVKDDAGNSLFDNKGAAATALEDANDYADSLAGNYDANGAAATAESNAKSYADSLAVNYDAAGTAAGLNDAMDLRVKVLEAIDHEKLATDASAAAVATVLDGAPEKFDTLKEVAEWISASESAASAADLVTRVGALEAIDHDAYVNADAALKSELEGEIAKKVDVVDGSRLITDAEGTKLEGIEEGAQVNVIELLEVNGVTATITDKKASVTLDCYTKDEIDTIIVENERVTAEALTDLDSRVTELVGGTYNKSEIDTMIENAIVLASNDDIDSLFN